MSPAAGSDSIGFDVEEGEKAALDAFAKVYYEYGKGALCRMAIARFVRAHGMFWPDMGRLDREAFPLVAPPAKMPPTPPPPAPKKGRGGRG